MNTRIIRFHRLGGPEVLQVDQLALPSLGPNDVLVRHRAIGVNFIDTYHRTGLYQVPGLPSGLGVEAAGSVYVTRPTLFHHADDPSTLQEMSSELFRVLASGDVTISVNQKYDFNDAAQAHRDLEGRRTTGSSVLIV